MERKAVRIVMCIAAILTAVITLLGKGMDGVFLPRTLTAEQALSGPISWIIPPMNDASSTIRPAKCWVHPVETLSHRSHPDRMAQRPISSISSAG